MDRLALLKAVLFAALLVIFGVSLHEAQGATPTPSLNTHPSLPLEEVDAHVASYLDAQEEVREIESAVLTHLPRATEALDDDDVAAAWAFFNDQGQALGSASSLLGVDLGASIAVDGEVFLLNDYSALNYSEFLQDEADVLLELTNGQYSDAETYLDDVRATGDAQALADASANVIISKIASIFGVKVFWAGLSDAMVEVMGDELEELGRHIDQKKIRKTLGTVRKLLSKATGEKFRTTLAGKIGKKAAGKVMAKIGARFVPFVGWAIVAGSIAWTLCEQMTED